MAKWSKNVGPCEIYKGYASPASLGKVFGGVIVTANWNIFEEKEDASGDISIGDHVIGQEAMAKGAITSASLAQLAALLGTSVEGSTTQGVGFDNVVGRDLRDYVDVYTLRLLVDGVADTVAANWIYIPAGTIRPDVSLNVNYNQQRAWGFNIKAHPVRAEDIASGGHLYNSGSPEYAVGRMMMFGKATSS